MIYLTREDKESIAGCALLVHIVIGNNEVRRNLKYEAEVRIGRFDM